MRRSWEWPTWWNRRRRRSPRAPPPCSTAGSTKPTRNFSSALARSAASRSCPVRVNLELVRETQGDRAAAAHDRARAEERYLSALAMVERCAAVLLRRQQRSRPATTGHSCATPLAGWQAKRHWADRVAPPAAAIPPPPPAPPPPPPALPLDRRTRRPRDSPRQLDPTGGDPLDKLLQVLQDAADRRSPPGDSSLTTDYWPAPAPPDACLSPRQPVPRPDPRRRACWQLHCAFLGRR